MKKKSIAIIGGGCLGLFLANLLADSGFELFIIEKKALLLFNMNLH